MMPAGNEWNAEIRPDARESLAFERVDADTRGRRWKRIALVAVPVLLIAGGAIGYSKYGYLLRFPAPGGTVPTVHADLNPIKVRPDEPGGMEVPNRDKLVYDQMAGTSSPRVERLLPPPESPKAPPPDATVAPPKPVEAPSKPAEIRTAKVPTDRDVGSIKPPAAQLSPGTQLPAGIETQTPKPVPAAAGTAVAVAAPTAKAPGGAAEGAFRIQIGAARSNDQAEQEWARLVRQHKDLIGDLGHSVLTANLGDKGIFYRLRAGPLKDKATAESLCSQLKQRNVGCLVVKPD